MAVQEKEKLIFEADDFKLAHDTEKIYDEKFKTKPTTYAKDAFKRFRKNKSSVVAAFIISILLLLSFIIPMLSPYKLEVSSTERLLLPKLFEAGTGFWDGTEDFEDQIYDEATGQVYGFDIRGVMEDSIKKGEKQYVNIPQDGSNYGTLVLLNYDSLKSGVLKNNKPFSFTSADELSTTIKLSNDNDLANKYANAGLYTISLVYTNQDGNEKTVELQSETSEVKDHTFDLKKALVDEGDTAATNSTIQIAVNGSAEGNYVGVSEIKFDLTTTDTTLQETIDSINLTNVSKMLQAKETPTWIGDSLVTNVFKAEIVPVSFTYDAYEVVYGMQTVDITEAKMQQWIDNGWIEFNFNDINSLKVLNEDKSPVTKITKLELKNGGPYGTYYEIQGEVSGYKFLGYDSQPKYWFGSQDDGTDLFLALFSGLKISLLIALAVSAFAFFIGIIWGSISGYYGGNVDLIMERFIEILRGVPWIVIMTVTILLLGNSITTFLIALCLVNWTRVSARTRTQFYRFKRREYVLASRTLGAKDRRLIFKHILPNGLGTIITGSILMIPGVIFTEATLSYLGLGLQGQNTLGVILSQNQKYLQSYPILLIVPAIIISLIMISFNLFGNGLRDALNPTLKGSE